MGKGFNTNKNKGFVRDESGNIIMTTEAAYLPGVQAAVTFSKDFFYEDRTIKPIPLPIDKLEINYIPWGDRNDYPQEVIAIVEKNPVASSLLEFKTDLVFGSGIKMGRMVDDSVDQPGMIANPNKKKEFREYTEEEIEADPELQKVADWLLNNNIDGQLGEVMTDINWFLQSNIELVLSNDKTEIAEINSRETTFSRYSEMDENGKITYHLYSAKWTQEGIIDKDFIITKNLDFKKPALDLKRKMGKVMNLDGKFEVTQENSFIYPIRFETPARKYYPSPYWHSIIKSGWLEFANAIPVFKKTLMTNSINVKYHVEISQDYFPRIFQELGIINDKAKCEARKIAEYKAIEDFLTGQENVGKPWISYFKMTPDGKIEIHDIKITVINNKVGGEYNEDSQEASAMTYTAFNVHPNLVGVIPSRNQSNLSGSDKRELLRIAQTFQVRKRNKFLEILKLIKWINKWPKQVVFTIPDMILTTLDQGKEVQQIANT